jgi:hypothetical protein
MRLISPTAIPSINLHLMDLGPVNIISREASAALGLRSNGDLGD